MLLCTESRFFGVGFFGFSFNFCRPHREGEDFFEAWELCGSKEVQNLALPEGKRAKKGLHPCVIYFSQ